MATMATDLDGTKRRQLLSFVIAGGEYAVPILSVREILQFEGLTPVPGTPRAIRGVINLRGSVVPVADLAVKFGLPETRVTRLTCVLVVEARVEGAPALVGLLTDAVNEVLELGEDEIEPPPSLAEAGCPDYIVGMGKRQKGFVLLVDVERILAAQDGALAAAYGEALRGALDDNRDPETSGAPGSPAEP